MAISTDEKYLRTEFSTFHGLLGAVGGWDLERVRSAIDLHDVGSFVSTSALGIVASRFAPVFSALELREAPALGIERVTLGGSRGAARRARESFGSVMYARGEPLFGDIFREHALMGFSWFQATWKATEDGAELWPELSWWPAAATWVNPYTGRFMAYASGGTGFVEMVSGDGKWFCLGDGRMPWLRGAVRAIGEQWAGARYAERDQAALSAYLGRKVPITTLPEGIAVKDAVGLETIEATKDIGKARSGAVFPFGTVVDTLDNLDAGSAALLEGLLNRRESNIRRALLGTAGLDGGTGGVYLSPALPGLLRSVVKRDLTAGGRAFSELGDAFGAINYGLSPDQSPAYAWLLPDPSEAERVDAKGKAYLQAAAIVKAERDAGLPPVPERIAQIYGDLGLPAPALPVAPPASTVPGGAQGLP